MSGTFGEMGNLLKQAQAMQRELDRVKDELARQTFEGRAGGGAVKVEVTGDGMVQKVRIDPAFAAGGDVALLEEAVLAALRDALQNAARIRRKKLEEVTGGLNLPGIL